jgi:peptidoglycan/LPS O-acetylase OafA/YrhL
MPKPTAENDIPELTALRILAALCVVVSHLHGFGIVSAEHVHRILDGGRPAVSFFFVLSGFIMNHKYPHLHAGDYVATKRYAQSRVARLYPTLLLALCIAFPSVIYLAATHAREQLLEFYALKDHYSFWLIASALAQILGLTGWIPAAAINQPWNGPAWSLSCEFLFYAVFPFIRPILQQQSSKLIISTVIMAWILQGIWIVAIDAFIAPNRAGFLVYQFPLTHIFEFMLGICAGIVVSRFNGHQLNVLSIVTTIIAMLVLAVIYFLKAYMPAYYGLTPIFAVLIVGTVRSSGSLWLAPLRNGIVVALGHASYALYMIHVPILIGASVLGIATRIGWFWLPLVMLASLLIHYGYAEPVRRFLLGRPRSFQRQPATSG